MHADSGTFLLTDSLQQIEKEKSNKPKRMKLIFLQRWKPQVVKKEGKDNCWPMNISGMF